MRTRSEWFLGPKDGDVLCVPPNACSNCCLSAVHLQTSRSYLGGGSTRDMRRMIDHQYSTNQASQHHQHPVNEAVNTSLYLYYKQQQQQQQQYQQIPMQRQSFHLSPEHMDTDESFSSFAGDSNSINEQMNLHSMKQQLPAIQQQLKPQQQPHKAPTQFNTRQAQEGQGLFLDTNYGRYDFDDKDIFITTTTDNNFNQYNNKINKDNNNHDLYTLSNRQHLMKTATSSISNEMTFPTTTHTLAQIPFSTISPTASSLSLHYVHANSSNNNRQNKFKVCAHQHGISKYFSTESLLNMHDTDDCLEDDIGDLDDNSSSSNSLMCSKLSYQSPRQRNDKLRREHNVHEQKSYNSTTMIHDITLNSANANTITATANNNSSPAAIDSKYDVDDVISNDIELVDCKSSAHYRHSTPMVQRRRLRQQHHVLMRHRLPSTSSTLYQSFNASLQAPMSSANLGTVNRFNVVGNSAGHISNYESQSTISSSGGGSGGGGGVDVGSGGNSNFVSIIFNVLDFLF